ncbi:MAG: HK97 family phage prohead protease [Arhodomonas sp.]|nr:HK97 family phage prohead protease [Arhodomonas sp.]
MTDRNVVRRTYPLREIKLAGTEAGADTMTFQGYGAVFGNVDYYGDVIEPGAFADSLAAAHQENGEWPAMLLQHGGWGLSADDLMPVGVWTELSEDGVGLVSKGTLADTQRGRESYTLMKMAPRPAITGLSIGYIPKDWEPRSKADEPRRRIKKADLIEVSLVTFPANTRARVNEVKSIINECSALADVEALLRDAGGFTRAEAKALVAQIKALDQRDADDGLVELAASITRNINTLRI